MRWLIAQPGPGWSVHDVYVGWVEGLRNAGEQVHIYNLDERLAFYSQALLPVGDPPADAPPDAPLKLRRGLTDEQAIELSMNGLAASLWKIRPDVMLLVSGFFADPQMLDHARRTGTRVVIVHTEEPYEVDRELELAAHADLNLINDPTHLARFVEVAPSVYAPHAYRPTVHHPGPPRAELRSDFAFVGTGFASRRWFLEQLAGSGALDGLDVLLGGNWAGVTQASPLWPWLATGDPQKCLDNADAADVYRSAGIGINLYRREHNADADAAGWAMGPREVEMAACGGFFLRDPRGEGDAVLPMLPTFSGPDEAAELIAWWHTHPEQRAAAGAAAAAAVADRTFDHHARHLLRLLDRQPVSA
jgi:hypothetical protein